MGLKMRPPNPTDTACLVPVEVAPIDEAAAMADVLALAMAMLLAMVLAGAIAEEEPLEAAGDP